MRKYVYAIGAILLLLLAIGCGGSEPETAVPSQPENATEAQTAAAKPQLIEFYATW